jgi:hypothetical protein
VNFLLITIQSFRKFRFSLLGLATILNIKTDQFNKILKDFEKLGWKRIYEYKGFDAWIDYGKVKLRKGLNTLTFEWDNWTDGSIEGRKYIIEELGKEKDLKVDYISRWNQYK